MTALRCLKGGVTIAECEKVSRLGEYLDVVTRSALTMAAAACVAVSKRLASP